MLPVVVTPSATQAVLDYLRPLLTGRSEPYAQNVKVQASVGTSRPLIYVRRIGGSSDLPGYDAPRMDFQVFHADPWNREQLALLAYALVKAAASDRAGAAAVSYMETMLGPRPMPDPANTTGEIYSFTVDLLVRPL